MMVLVIAELNGEEISVATRSALSAAKQIGGQVTCLVAGTNIAAAAQQAACLEGVSAVWSVESQQYAHRLAEPWAELIASKADGFSHVIMGVSTFSKNVLPRAAALAKAEPIADVIEIESPTRFVRPIYAGDILQAVESEQPCLFLTVRATAFEKAGQAGSAVPVTAVDTPTTCAIDSKWVSEQSSSSDRPELSSADIVFSGGRGLQSKANFDRLQKIADHYGAAMGASRAAVDADMAPNDWQVGQTGQIVAPAVYVALGISGATQHLAGMKDSKVVIAINKDPDAPIFSVADYGLVADVEAVLTQWEEGVC
jgi:electron transfer flavoprotein alpha subunit